MSLASRIATDLWRIHNRPDHAPAITVTCRELKKCGWTAEQIDLLDELSKAETHPCCSPSLH